MHFSFPMFCALLTFTPASGQAFQWFPRSEDRGSFEGQLFLGRASLCSIEVTPPSGFLKVDAPDQNLWGGRLAWDVLRWGPGVLQASGGLAYGSRSPLRFINSAGASGEVGADLHLRHQWMGGLLYLVEGPHFRPGFGLDLRRDALMVKAAPELRSYGWINRLWFRGVAQYHLAPMRGVAPFVALEIAAPVSNYQPTGVGYIGDLDHLGLPANGDQGVAARTHAPRLHYSFALGMRFGAPRPRLSTSTQARVVYEPMSPIQAASHSPIPQAPAPAATAARKLDLPLPNVIVLDEAALHFALNRAEISEEGRRVVAQWAQKILTILPQPKLNVIGHSDSTGTLPHNLKLSKRRAQAVAEVLRSHGLTVASGDIEGHGPKSPVATNQNEAGRARNRRVEIHLEDGLGKGKVESSPLLEQPKAARKSRPGKQR